MSLTEPKSATEPVVQGAHLVGSVNLPDAEAVFRAAASHLGDRLARIPDGEVGERYYWLQFQGSRFAATPGLVQVGEPGFLIRGEFDPRPFVFDGSVAAADLRFPDLGYAAAALDSYVVFAALRDEGVIDRGVRFQVSLPTPAAVTSVFLAPGPDQAAFEAVYEKALLAELARILDGVPAAHLAIQWDTAVEFAFLERASIGGFPVTAWFGETEAEVLEGVLQRAVKLAEAVPPTVELGYHLCYGDIEEDHFIQPTDAGHLADVVEGLLARVPRSIDFIHLPVPIERDDEAYFAPLAKVAPHIGGSTEIYLGLIHHQDGAEGAAQRIAAASTALPRFGVATECGFGRGPAERTGPLLDLHAEVTQPW